MRLCDVSTVSYPRCGVAWRKQALGITPEGCSSVHFERIMGKEKAQRMLGAEGWKPTAAEAKEDGWVAAVVPKDDLQAAVQQFAEQWLEEGRGKAKSPEMLKEMKAVNAVESVQMADAFMDVPFLEGQRKFLASRGKTQLATMFAVVKATRPLWIRFK